MERAAARDARRPSQLEIGCRFLSILFWPQVFGWLELVMTLLFALSMRATRAAITEIGTPAGAASMGLVGKPPINRFGFIDEDEGGVSGFCAWCCATCCLSCGTIGIVVYWIVVFVSGNQLPCPQPRRTCG